MGYEDGAGRRGVEKFMQDYFRHATRVGELTRILLTALEATHTKAEPMLTRLMSRRRKAAGALCDQAEPADRRRRGRLLCRSRQHDPHLRRGGAHRAPCCTPMRCAFCRRTSTASTTPYATPPRPTRIFLDTLLKHGNPGTGPAADERAGRTGRLHSGIRPHRRDDAVQHVSPLYGGRTHHPGDQPPGADRARRVDRGSALVLAHPARRGEPQGPLPRHPAPRHRQGPPRGSFGHRRPDRPPPWRRASACPRRSATRWNGWSATTC